MATEVDDIEIIPKSNIIYATNGTLGSVNMSMSITAINGSNDQIINKIEIPRDSIHYRLASNHMTNILYVLSGSGKLYAMDGNTFTISEVRLSRA